MRVPFGDTLRGVGRLGPERLRGLDWAGLLEKGLLVLLTLALARMAWVVLTPVGSFGPWEGRQAQLLSAQARQALFASFDPFFRAEASGDQGGAVVTSLALTVYGIRLNEGTGLGSAIVATPDGVQNSFAVGDEIMPGVVLKAVAFDHITIDRGGAEEQVFLDQSGAAPVADPAAGNAPAAAPTASGGQGAAPPPPFAPPGGGVTVDALRQGVGFAPRLENGRVTGIAVQSKGAAFAAAGFRPDDIITQINGQPVSDAGALQTMLAPGARLSLTVDRGAAPATVNLIVQGK